MHIYVCMFCWRWWRWRLQHGCFSTWFPCLEFFRKMNIDQDSCRNFYGMLFQYLRKTLFSIVFGWNFFYTLYNLVLAEILFYFLINNKYVFTWVTLTKLILSWCACLLYYFGLLIFFSFFPHRHHYSSVFRGRENKQKVNVKV